MAILLWAYLILGNMLCYINYFNYSSFDVEYFVFLQASKYRSSPSEVFLGNSVLKICSKFTEEHQYQCLISIKLLFNFIEIILRHGCSSVNLLHIFRTPFYNNIYGGLLLKLNTCGQTAAKLRLKTKDTFVHENIQCYSKFETQMKGHSRFRWSFVLLEKVPYVTGSLCLKTRENYKSKTIYLKALHKTCLYFRQ